MAAGANTDARDLDAPDPVAPDFVARRNRGRQGRARVPRSAQGPWVPPSDRADPVTLLEEQAVTRIAEIVPLRYARMSESPFAFYRGTLTFLFRS